VVRDPERHEQVLRDLRNFAASLGYRVMKEMPSPILGAKGNREFLIWLQPNG
jgi:23S rRNA (cytidine1920-2'-O)/16S rRNA (cytidine1409-2'-O)-methyltransferase